MKKIKVMAISLFVLLMFMSGFMARAQSNDADFETFSKYIFELQKNPEDTALREKIIKLALTFDPAPAIPQEVERFMARGQAAMEIAQEPGDFKDAAAEFEKAALAAPWLGNVYYNLGIVQDKVGDYPAAINNLKLYLLAAPGASDTKAVEMLIYKIEFKHEKAAKASSPAAISNKQLEQDAEFIEKLNGVRFLESGFPNGFQNDGNPDYTFFELRGDEVIRGMLHNGKIQWYPANRARIKGRAFVIPNYSWCNNGFNCAASGTIYEDRIEVVQDQNPINGGRAGTILNMERIR